MGKLAMAAKITHVPSMFLSEQDGPHKGCREAAINGLKELGRRARERDVDTLLVLDTHWLVNAGYHINANKQHKGIYTSTEFPHFIRDLNFDYPGDPDFGQAIADIATDMGVLTRCHSDVPSLGMEYGTLVPVRYMNEDGKFKVVSIAAWCYDAEIEESCIVGEAIAKAIEESDNTVAVLASGSLSHRIWPNKEVDAGIFKVSRPFNEFVDHAVLELWKQGRFEEFINILPDYAVHCSGEGHMHDTIMLLSLLGWDRYQGKVEVLTEYFGSSGTGQVNVEFPLQ